MNQFYLIFFYSISLYYFFLSGFKVSSVFNFNLVLEVDFLWWRLIHFFIRARKSFVLNHYVIVLFGFEIINLLFRLIMNYLSHQITNAWEVRHLYIVFLNIKSIIFFILFFQVFVFLHVSFVPVINLVWNFIDIEQAFHQNELDFLVIWLFRKFKFINFMDQWK